MHKMSEPLEAEQVAPPRSRGEPDVGPDGAESAALRLRSVEKSFPGVKALSDVSLEVRPGEVHALVGENGAGKSTLMAVASGALVPDAGTVEIGGQVLAHVTPEQARRLGLGIVRQHPALLLDLTVAENVALGIGISRVGGLRRAAAWAQSHLDAWEMGIDARSRVADLTVEQRYLVEIARALALEPSILILDEPTEHLSLEEVDRLFAKVRDLVSTGSSVVYISHRIPEVKKIADRITVLRDGHVRGTFEADELDEQRIVELVVGRALDTVFPDKGSVVGTVRDEVRLEARGLRAPGVDGVDLTVRSGEVVGLAGVQGNGQAGLVRALAGLEDASGELRISGRTVRLGSNSAVARAGLVYVPADRHGEGVFLPLSVTDNMVMSTLPSVAHAGLVSARAGEAVAAQQVANLGVKTPSVQAPVGTLSGGNQQKVVLARALLSTPSVIVAEEPTQGVDAGARVDIYRILRKAAADGAAVVILSSDGVELQGLCDRVLIMSRGSVVEELSGGEVTEDAIARAALTATTVRNRPQGATERRGRLAAWMSGDQSPAAVLGVLFVLLGVVVAMNNGSYLSSFNLNNLLLLAAPLLFIGAAQHLVVLGAGIDLSVGPLTGLLVVIASFWVVDDGNAVIGFALMLLAALVVGLVNGLLVSRLGLSPVVVTLAMFMGLQGVFLTLRDTPGGLISSSVSLQLSSRIGFVPVVAVVAVLVALALEWALRRSAWGVSLRALGSDADVAASVGVRVARTRVTSYVVASLLTFPAALVVMAQIGIGDGRPSVGYTLSSVTVVVLAGASVFGGRGSFLGVVAAALLVQQVLNASPFLGLSQAWSYWLPGLITLGAAALYARLRRVRRQL